LSERGSALPATPSILVLGIGNVLLEDEGLGVRAVERLAATYRLPPAVNAMDGGTLGLDLLPHVEQAGSLLVVDAVQADQPTGSLVRLEGDAVPAMLAIKTSVHQVGLADLIAASRLRGTFPDRLVLWGMVPATVDWGTELSPVVAAHLEDLVAAVVRELRAWGVPVEAREQIRRA
jgi:hydrogenase maturation protease